MTRSPPSIAPPRSVSRNKPEPDDCATECASSSWARRISRPACSRKSSLAVMRLRRSIRSRRGRRTRHGGEEVRRAPLGGEPRPSRSFAEKPARAPTRRRTSRRLTPTSPSSPPTGCCCLSRSSTRRDMAASTCMGRCCRAGAARRRSQRAIMAGDAESGVMVMKMEAGLDTGPVALDARKRRSAPR